MGMVWKNVRHKDIDWPIVDGNKNPVDRKIAESLQRLFITLNAGDSQRRAILDLVKSLLDEREFGHVIPRDYPPSDFMLEEKKMRNAFLPKPPVPKPPVPKHPVPNKPFPNTGNVFASIDYLKPTANVEDLIDTVNRILQLLK